MGLASLFMLTSPPGADIAYNRLSAVLDVHALDPHGLPHCEGTEETSLYRHSKPPMHKSLAELLYQVITRERFRNSGLLRLYLYS